MKTKRFLSIILSICLILSLMPIAYASETSYTINGVTVSASSGKAVGKSQCSLYASQILAKIWTINNPSARLTSFNGTYNLVKGKSAEERKMTEAHVKEYIQNAPLGSRIRICSTSDTSSNDCDLIPSGEKGHTMVLVAKDDLAGTFTILHNKGNGCGEDETYTYKGFSDAWQEYSYFYYIADYSAAATNYNGNGDDTTPSLTAQYSSCNVRISCLSGQTVNLYNNPGDTSKVTYFSKGQTVNSTYCATLSDGSTWYRITANHNGVSKTFWLKYESSKMTVIPITSSYTVTFNANGGSVSQSSATVTSGSTYGTMPTPTRSGYTFDGWYTSSSGGTKVTSSTTVSLAANQTLYAHWNAAPTAAAQYFSCNVTITCFSGQTVNLYSNPGDSSRASYFSKGQTVSSTYGATLSDGSTWYRITANDGGTSKTFWLKYESSKMAFIFDAPTYTVTFNANGGSILPSSKLVTSGSSYGTLPTPTRSNYTFDGWYTSADGGSKVTSSSTFNGSSNITLYAHWTAVPADVKITFDPNGGRTSQSSKTITAGSYLTDLPTATRSGYIFLGWAMDKIDPNSTVAQTTTIVSENMYSFDKDTTLYAYWRPDKTTTPEICTHTKGKFQYSDRTHPHYNYYSCSKCGETYTDYSTSADTSCESCWGPWSGWSTTPVYASSTRQVETRSVQLSAGATEYRYGRYIDSTGGHICWCSTYLSSKGYSGITVQYSSWSTNRYAANGKVWTCGYCNGSHTGIHHYDSSGRPCWNEYSLSSGSYYWEESRQTSASYETQYRYRDLISG